MPSVPEGTINQNSYLYELRGDFRVLSKVPNHYGWYSKHRASWFSWEGIWTETWRSCKNKCILRNYIPFCIRHIICRSRNKVLGRSLLTTVTTLCNKIENFIHNNLKQKFELAKSNNKIDIFEKDFLYAKCVR